MKAHVNSNGVIFWGQSFRHYFAGETNEPFARCRSAEYRTLRGSIKAAVHHNLDVAYFRNEKLAVLNVAPAWYLWKGDAIVSPKTLETGIAGGFTRFSPTEEGLHSQIYPLRHILQDLTMYQRKFWYTCFQRGKCVLLVIISKTFLFFFPRSFTFTQEVIIELTTLFQRIIKQAALSLSRVNPILESLNISFNFLFYGRLFLFQNQFTSNLLYQCGSQAGRRLVLVVLDTF